MCGRSEAGRNVAVEIPTASCEDLLHLVENRGSTNVADSVIQLLRDEVDRVEVDNGTTGYSSREIELIRRLLREVNCRD